MERRYQIDDYGLLIGLLSTPEGMNTDDFFQEEIKENLSTIYKKGRFGGKADNTKLYTYKGYKTFGDHDLAVLALIDDFSYPNRVFHPSHGSRCESGAEYYNYEYQIMTCLNTLPYSKEKENTDTLHELMWNEKSSIDEYPYICITRAKVSNYFLLGNGIDFIELVKRYLLSCSEKYNGSGNSTKKMRTVVLDNMGCEELVIINFTYCISLMAEFNHEIRCINFSALEKFDKEQAELILERKFITDRESKFAGINWQQAHVFSSFYSLPGYSMQTDCVNCLQQEETKEKLLINFNFVWDIKPGHARNFKEDFGKLLQEQCLDSANVLYKEPLRLNNSAWLYQLTFGSEENDENREALLFKRIEALRNFDNQKKHVRKLHMKMEVYEVAQENTSEGLSMLDEHCVMVDMERHPQRSLYMGKLEIGNTELCELRTMMQRANVSKLLRERIMKMYNNYNNCVADPMFFASFIDLHGFMRAFKREIKKYACSESTESPQSFQEWMNTQVLSFEQAYYNRFHQSNRMREMTDFNLEWNGGIQQIISPLDNVFKEILAQYGYKFYDKFVHVSGYERVQVNENTFKINMLHVTYPELFASTIWKEVFNFHWRYILAKCKDVIHKDIFFVKDDFHEYLKYSIEHRPEFNRFNSVHLTLLEIIDKDFTNDFVADTLSFYYGYDGNFEDFSYWYWKYLFQTPLYYSKSHVIEQSVFLKFLTRILFIKLLEIEDTGVDDIENMIFYPADPVLSELWVTNFRDVLSFTRILKIIFGWHNYRGIIKSMAINLMKKDVDAENPETLKDKNGNDICIEKAVRLARSMSYKRDLINFYGCFRNGQLPLVDYETAGFELVKLFGGFLRYLKDLSEESASSNYKKAQILPRDGQGKPAIGQLQDYYSNILADPHGGMFCPDSEVQKRCFKARASLYRALFDLCMKNKKQQIDIDFTENSNNNE